MGRRAGKGLGARRGRGWAVAPLIDRPGRLQRSAVRVGGMALLAATTVLGGAGVVAPSPAAAANLGCGDTVTSSVTLSANIGPCSGDGLIVTGSGITVDLGAHTVKGSGDMRADQVGIRVVDSTNVVVTNGTVTAFNAGVALENTTGSTVSSIRAKSNRSTGAINHGDGIVLDGSTNNKVVKNDVSGNGPFSGVSMLDGADHNLVSANTIYDNTLVRTEPAQVAPRQENFGVRFDSFSSFNTVDGNKILRNGSHGVNAAGFEHTGNVVSNNLVQGNGQYGILEPGDNYLLSGNRVVSNGFDQFEVPGRPKGRFDGILVFGNLGGGKGVIENNQLISNAHDGFSMRTNGFTFFGTYHPPVVDEIRGNVAISNGRNGIFVECDFVANLFPQHVCLTDPPPHEGQHLVRNTARGNGGADAGKAAWDLYDENPNCDSNQWIDNTGVTFNPPCTLNKSH